MYDFETIHDRHHDHSIKYEEKRLEEDPQMIPLWVADMDFEVLPEIEQALHQRAAQKMFGYISPWQDYYDSVCGWMKRRHGMEVQPEWISPVCGVVPAIRIALQAYTQPEEAVMILTPVYHPFKESIVDAKRKLVNCPLIYEDGKYTIDFKKMEHLIRKENVRLLIFCNPHNPIGRVWSKEELQETARIAQKYEVLVISDEIHMDFTRPDHPFTSMLKAAPEISGQLVVCTAPSKTFNLAALQTSNLIIPNWRLKRKFDQCCHLYGMNTPNVFGIEACIAGYTHGDAWVDELNAAIDANAEAFCRILAERLPSVRVCDKEGLYLLWVDFNAYHLESEEIDRRMEQKAHLWTEDGIMFGDDGTGFQRINLAAPRSVIEEAAGRICDAFEDLELRN